MTAKQVELRRLASEAREQGHRWAALASRLEQMAAGVLLSDEVELAGEWNGVGNRVLDAISVKERMAVLCALECKAAERRARRFKGKKILPRARRVKKQRQRLAAKPAEFRPTAATAPSGASRAATSLAAGTPTSGRRARGNVKGKEAGSGERGAGSGE